MVARRQRHHRQPDLARLALLETPITTIAGAAVADPRLDPERASGVRRGWRSSVRHWPVARTTCARSPCTTSRSRRARRCHAVRAGQPRPPSGSSGPTPTGCGHQPGRIPRHLAFLPLQRRATVCNRVTLGQVCRPGSPSRKLYARPPGVGVDLASRHGCARRSPGLVSLPATGLRPLIVALLPLEMPGVAGILVQLQSTPCARRFRLWGLTTTRLARSARDNLLRSLLQMYGSNLGTARPCGAAPALTRPTR